MADLTFTDRMFKNTYLRRYGESSASDFQCLLCLSLEKFRRCTPLGGKKLLEAVNLRRWSRYGGWPHPDCIALFLFTYSHTDAARSLKFSNSEPCRTCNISFNISFLSDCLIFLMLGVTILKHNFPLICVVCTF